MSQSEKLKFRKNFWISFPGYAKRVKHRLCNVGHSVLKIIFSDDIELTAHEKSLLQKCLNLIHHRFPSVFHQQNYMTSNNTTTKTINEQGNLSNTQNWVTRKEYGHDGEYAIFKLKVYGHIAESI